MAWTEEQTPKAVRALAVGSGEQCPRAAGAARVTARGGKDTGLFGTHGGAVGGQAGPEPGGLSGRGRGLA